tara:strand:- start:1278 stop:1904 length:627 start_codon:yes stop_codon:yes gene_type:complete
MRYIRHNFDENYSAFDGEDRRNILADELAKALVMEPTTIAKIFEENNIEVTNPSSKHLAKMMREHQTNHKLMEQITAVVIALNSDFDGGQHSFLGIGKGGGKAARQGRRAEKDYAKSQGGDGEKGQFFKKLGGFINKNKDKIGDAAAGIQGILANRKQMSGLQTGVNHYQRIQVPNANGPSKMPVWGWVAIGVGSLVVIGGLIYATRR